MQNTAGLVLQVQKKKWPEIVLAFLFNCVHLHFSGGSCVYGALNDYPSYICSKKEKIKP